MQFADRGDKKQLEEGLGFSPKFDDKGLITAVACDWQTNEILMIAYMNEEALRQTIAIAESVYYSRSRQELWHKGATSGNVQKVHQILTDCDQDAIVLKVEQVGAAAASCHTGRKSCFYREIPFGNDVVSTDEVASLAFTDNKKYFDPDEVYGRK